jgi:hypothetical protein
LTVLGFTWIVSLVVGGGAVVSVMLIDGTSSARSSMSGPDGRVLALTLAFCFFAIALPVWCSTEGVRLLKSFGHAVWIFPAVSCVSVDV